MNHGQRDAVHRPDGIRIRGTKMNHFINFSVNTGLSINAYRKVNSSASDIIDLALAVTRGDENVTCDLEGAKDALEDGAAWAGTDVTQEALEEIHDLICEFETR